MPYRIHSDGGETQALTIDGPDGNDIRHGSRSRRDAGQARSAAGRCVLVLFEQGRRADRELDSELDGKRFSVWYDRGLIAGQPYRDVLQKRIETVKAVVVLWTENSIGSKWVRAEADLADKHKKAHLPARSQARSEAHSVALRGKRSHHPSRRHARPDRSARPQRGEAAHLRRDVAADDGSALKDPPPNRPCGIR